MANEKPVLSAIVSDSANKRGGYMIIGVNQWLRRKNPVRILAFGLAFLTVPAPIASAQTPPSTEHSEPSIAIQVQTSTQPYQLPPAKLAQATALGRIRISIHFGAEFWEVAVLWFLLATGTATRLARWAVSKTSRRWLQTAIFSAILAALVYIVSDLPIQAIGHAFSLRYGISIESWPAWLLDEAKTLGLTLLVEAPLLTSIFGLLHWSPRRYWLWFAAAAVPITILGTFLLPTLIEPIFNDFEPLAQSHPALAQQLQRVVART